MIEVQNLVKDYHTTSGTNRVLDGLSFTVKPGERVAVLGRNGAGKSTLVRLLGGVEYPTSGFIRRSMSLSWPLGLSSGFSGHLSGRDTIKFIARLYGRDYEQTYDYVMDFSELGKAIRDPVMTYSSGMSARLAFGLSLAIDFDCYLIDEVIFVGDQRFQKKCSYEIFEKRADRALLVVSHDHNIIRQYCHSSLVLSQGRGKMFEDLETAISIYEHV